MKTMNNMPFEEPLPLCPVCGQECETVYRQDGTIIGCERCTKVESAEDAKECYWYINRNREEWAP